MPWLRAEDQLRTAAGAGRRGHHVVPLPHVLVVVVVLISQRRRVAVGRRIVVRAAPVVAEEPLPFARLLVPIEGILEGDVAELLLSRM